MGYQNRGLEFNKFVWCCGTFQAVGSDQDKMTLGDIKLANDAGNSVGEVTLSLISGTGSNLKLTNSDTKNFVGKSASFIYFSQAELDAVNADPELDPEFKEQFASVKAGWYHNTDENFVECFNDYVIPYGLAYAVKQSGSGYSVMYAGSVVKDADMPSVALEFNKFVWTGNAAPSDMTLKDFAPSREEGNSVGEVTLSLISGTGSNLKLTGSDTKNFVGKSASFIYFSQAELDAVNADPELDPEFKEQFASVKAGWYHNTDENFVECFNDYVIPAGLGFAVKAFQTGYSLDLPGAL